jgi:F-type H+-transporting ATPase subunit delta
MSRTNTSIFKVAKRYAASIFALSNSAEQAAQLVQSFQALAQALRDNPQVLAVLNHPHITREAKADLLKAAMPGADELTQRALQVIAMKNRAYAIGEIADALLEIMHAQSGEIEAVLTTARPMQKADQQAIAAAINTLTGKQAVIRSEIDAALIGGFTVKLGSTLMDASVQTKLAKFKQHLSDVA